MADSKCSHGTEARTMGCSTFAPSSLIAMATTRWPLYVGRYAMRALKHIAVPQPEAARRVVLSRSKNRLGTRPRPR